MGNGEKMSLRVERSEAWQSQSLRLQLLETLREHFVPCGKAYAKAMTNYLIFI
ncbi:MAG: hypothetical protein V7L11_08590 [Nostoc sp.]|uniref:hypothetical protein n=1 Tax=Nostoc sp. TaxID=1180 RepID=UPI002FFAE77A